MTVRIREGVRRHSATPRGDDVVATAPKNASSPVVGCRRQRRRRCRRRRRRGRRARRGGEHRERGRGDEGGAGVRAS